MSDGGEAAYSDAGTYTGGTEAKVKGGLAGIAGAFFEKPTAEEVNTSNTYLSRHSKPLTPNSKTLPT